MVDAGMTTDRRFELTAVQEPTTIRWSKRSRNLVTVTEGGYDRERVGDAQTKVTLRLFRRPWPREGVRGFARRAAAKDADAFAQRIKAAVEAS